MAYNHSNKTLAEYGFDEHGSSSLPPRGRITSSNLATPTRGQFGHVPLHRRGTSRTYERLEDLLKEAGYKETKILTPETERTESRGEGRTGGARSGMDAVVSFLSGLIPSTSSNDVMPPSPTPRRREEPTTPSPLSAGRLPGRYDGSLRRALRPRSSATESLRAYAQRAAAQGHIRHMASTPNISKRNGAHDGTSRRHASARHHAPPPMPSNWLNSVSNAVAGSSTSGVYIGGPSARRVPVRASRPSTSGSKDSKPVLTDRTNGGRPLSGYLQAKMAPSTVSTVRVVCRSAPTSRSSSRVGDRRALPSDKGKQRDVRSSKGKKSQKPSDSVPSLSTTELENDVWETTWVDGRRVSSTFTDNLDFDSDSDDDGELDLARMLVNPKRQNSIHSLRRHLHRSESARALREQAVRPREFWMFDDDEDVAIARKGSKLKLTDRRTSIEDGDAITWGDVGFDLPQPKRRRGIPGTWTSRNTRS
ncbi:hypothetical protein EIP86_008254 [Pleurotus ostreatoroseus]|nr:hypothetical protein EIP86_008254 [Pleurotus ostreatoroseus]